MTITQSQHESLNALSEKRREAKNRLVALLKQRPKDKVAIGIAKGELKRATADHSAAYRGLGLSRQSEWQRERISRGLCRQCGKESDGRSRCPACRATGNRSLVKR